MRLRYVTRSAGKGRFLLAICTALLACRPPSAPENASTPLLPTDLDEAAVGAASRRILEDILESSRQWDAQYPPDPPPPPPDPVKAQAILRQLHRVCEYLRGKPQSAKQVMKYFGAARMDPCASPPEECSPSYPEVGCGCFPSRDPLFSEVTVTWEQRHKRVTEVNFRLMDQNQLTEALLTAEFGEGWIQGPPVGGLKYRFMWFEQGDRPVMCGINPLLQPYGPTAVQGLAVVSEVSVQRRTRGQ